MRDPPDGNIWKGAASYPDGKQGAGRIHSDCGSLWLCDCSGCEHKSRCLYKYNAEKNPDRNKVTKINERWEELKEESNANIPE